MSLDEEQRLIARAQQGEVQAYEALVKQYQEVAFRAAYLITHDEHEAADAAQEGFLRAYHALHSFDLSRPFRPWLLRIVTNLALNRVLSLQRRASMTERYARQTLSGQQARIDRWSRRQTRAAATLAGGRRAAPTRSAGVDRIALLA